jgi:N utilization substance protein A
MSSLIGQSIDTLCSEHGLDRELVIDAMREAVRAAARKQFRDEAGDNVQVDWNVEDGIIEISVPKTIVEEVVDPKSEITLEEAIEAAQQEDLEVGDKLLIPLPNEEMGRIAAQTAKQILVQKVREAIRKKVYEEYVDRKGELVNGTVKRFERGDMIIDLGNNLEAVVPRSEQSRGETWSPGERIRVVIIDVLDHNQKGQQIKCSRASEELLKRLFEMEVPEIYDETVVIKSAVREPGDRAKIAVASNEKDVDPVGACVGMKGSRVQAIIKELRGEKIDIIEWSDEPSMFAANALSPARVSQVRITDIENRVMEVIVSEDQLSLAIGKKGQNVRLATRLVGWDIKIISEEVLKREITKELGKVMAAGETVPLTAIEGVTANQAEMLAARGITDIEALAAAGVDDISDILDVSLDEAESISSAAKNIVAAKNGGDASMEGEENEAEEGEGPLDGSAADELVIAAEAGPETENEPSDDENESVGQDDGTAISEPDDEPVAGEGDKKEEGN